MYIYIYMHPILSHKHTYYFHVIYHAPFCHVALIFVFLESGTLIMCLMSLSYLSTFLFFILIYIKVIYYIFLFLTPLSLGREMKISPLANVCSIFCCLCFSLSPPFFFSGRNKHVKTTYFYVQLVIFLDIILVLRPSLFLPYFFLSKDIYFIYLKRPGKPIRVSKMREGLIYPGM